MKMEGQPNASEADPEILLGAAIIARALHDASYGLSHINTLPKPDRKKRLAQFRKRKFGPSKDSRFEAEDARDWLLRPSEGLLFWADVVDIEAEEVITGARKMLEGFAGLIEKYEAKPKRITVPTVKKIPLPCWSSAGPARWLVW